MPGNTGSASESIALAPLPNAHLFASPPASTLLAETEQREYPYEDENGRYRLLGAGAGAKKEYERDVVDSTHSVAELRRFSVAGQSDS